MLEKIEVITYHKADGNILPLIFRIIDENGEFQTVKINKILTIKEEKVSGNINLIYICSAILFNTMKNFKLKFDALNTSWYLMK